MKAIDSHLATTLGLTVALLLATQVATFGQDSARAASDARLLAAIEQFEAGDQLGAIPVLEQLVAQPTLTPADRSQARKYLGLGYLFREEPQRAVTVFKALVGDDPDFGMRELALSYEKTPSDFAVRHFAQATLEWRQEQLQRQRERLEQTSRKGAFVRSLLLPGLGQRYQGFRGRSWALMALTGGAVGYAVVADLSYRNARDRYDSAQIGDDFDGLWRDYSDKSDVADLALGVVGAVWALNLLDAALSGPNLTGLESVAITPMAGHHGGLLVSLRTEF